MHTFDDIVSLLVERLRRGPAAGFMPRRDPAAAAVTQRRALRAARGLNTYRDVYHCPASTWGADDGWDPPMTSDAAAALLRQGLPKKG